MKRSIFSQTLVLFLWIAIGLFGCASSAKEPERYIELRIARDSRIQILIRDDVWRGIFTVHGYGGYAHNIHFWSTLGGEGPTYVDPSLMENSNTQFAHHGKITVDRKNKRVVIDLQRVVSKTGESEKLEPSPANGVYLIKKITEEPFMQPEK
jgi:hypothetical protein